MVRKIYFKDGVCQRDIFAFHAGEVNRGTLDRSHIGGEKVSLFSSLLFFCRLCADVGGLYPPDETLLSLHHVPLIPTVALAHWDESIPLG
jgi:hypothetical protein